VTIDPLDLTCELVAIDSQNPGGLEAEIARFVDHLARSWGFESRIVETAPGRCNVIASVDAGGETCLALCGHLDTKPVGDAADRWSTNPFEVVVENDVARGLGIADMKGAIAAMLLAARLWSSRTSRGRVELVFTADEEAGSQFGARALSERREVGADAMVIGEPSGIERAWEAIFLVSRGICCFDVVIEGRQGHSGLSGRLPSNASVAAGKVVIALGALEPEFEARPNLDYRPSVNAGAFLQGGVFFGVHPGHAVVASEIRTVPGMTRARLDAEIRGVVARAVPDDLHWDLRYRSGGLGWMSPYGIEPDHRLVGVSRRACKEALGRELPLAAYPGGTDATWFGNVAGIPTIPSLGPGLLTVAHGANEHIRVEELSEAIHLYERLIAAYFESD
jgi:succinyl-diaminopimelate desuccinylase